MSSRRIDVNTTSFNRWKGFVVLSVGKIHPLRRYTYSSGPSCSKLTTSLVNETLKFQMLISQICQYFLLKKCKKLLQCKSFSHFFNKNINVFGY